MSIVSLPVLLAQLSPLSRSIAMPGAHRSTKGVFGCPPAPRSAVLQSGAAPNVATPRSQIRGAGRFACVIRGAPLLGILGAPNRGAVEIYGRLPPPRAYQMLKKVTPLHPLSWIMILTPLFGKSRKEDQFPGYYGSPSLPRYMQRSLDDEIIYDNDGLCSEDYMYL